MLKPSAERGGENYSVGVKQCRPVSLQPYAISAKGSPGGTDASLTAIDQGNGLLEL